MWPIVRELDIFYKTRTVPGRQVCTAEPLLLVCALLYGCTAAEVYERPLFWLCDLCSCGLVVVEATLLLYVQLVSLYPVGQQGGYRNV